MLTYITYLFSKSFTQIIEMLQFFTLRPIIIFLSEPKFKIRLQIILLLYFLCLFSVHFVKSAQGRRFVAFAAPTVWNSLPLQLRMSLSILSFHSHLKIHLFPP